MGNVTWLDTNGEYHGLRDTTLSADGHDTALCQAAGALISTVRTGTGAEHDGSGIITRPSAGHAKMRAAAQMRDEDASRADRNAGYNCRWISRKGEDALGALVEWMDYEDARLGQFAVDLVSEISRLCSAYRVGPASSAVLNLTAMASLSRMFSGTLESGPAE